MAYSADNKVIAPFDGRKFDELFEVVALWKNSNAQPVRIPGLEVSKFMDVSVTKGYTEKTGKNWVSPVEVDVSGEILTWISSNMLPNDDRLYFEAVLFDDDVMHIYVKHNSIISSRLLGRFEIGNIFDDESGENS